MIERGEAARSWYEPPPQGFELARYALCAFLVLSAVAAGAALLDRTSTGSVATEAPDAIEIDWPPALASALPRSDAPDGLEQQATQAAPPAPAPPPPKPEVETLPEPPPAPDPAAIVQTLENTPPPPAPPAPAPEEQSSTGSAVPDAAAMEAQPAARTPRARVIAIWQRAMVEQLEKAKRAIHRRAGLGGTVEIAFRIDRQGAIVGQSIKKTSGNPALDEVALALLAAAAPFPPPPPGLGEAGLSFVVPVHVDSRR